VFNVIEVLGKVVDVIGASTTACIIILLLTAAILMLIRIGAACICKVKKALRKAKRDIENA
jgi:UPF0716 family protein affecting phage T7 exclusion